MPLTGTAGPDTMTAPSGYGEFVEGGGGDDRLTVPDFTTPNVINESSLLGGLGNDTLTGGMNSYDTLDGGAGNDALVGQAQRPHDFLAFSTATSGVRVNLANEGPQDIGGGQGIDTIIGVWGVLGTSYGDTISGGAGIGIFYAGLGDDVVNGGPNIDALYGEEGADTLSGSDGADSLYGGPGADSMSGGAGNDFFDLSYHYTRDLRGQVTESGDDVIDGGPGFDVVNFYPYGPGGINIDLRMTTPQQMPDGLGAKTFLNVEGVNANDGADTLTGTDGDNEFYAFGGNNVVNGLGGADTLIAGQGNDTLSGGAGDDLIDPGGGGGIVDGGAGTDFVVFGAANVDLGLGVAKLGANTVSLSGIENVGTSGFGDTLRGDTGNNALSGGSSAQIFGAAGADTIAAASGSNYLRGDDGGDSISGGSSFDDINGNTGDDTARGGLGDDWVVGGKDNDVLFGDAGGDVVWGNLGADTLEGGDADDQVRGGQGDDIVSGGAGADYVSGDRGNDTITGGAGADLFHGSQDAGIDRVLDFRLAEGDRVMLDPGTTYNLSEVGADTVIDMGGGHQMVLVGVQLSTLTSGWIFQG